MRTLCVPRDNIGEVHHAYPVLIINGLRKEAPLALFVLQAIKEMVVFARLVVQENTPLEAIQVAPFRPPVKTATLDITVQEVLSGQLHLAQVNVLPVRILLQVNHRALLAVQLAGALQLAKQLPLRAQPRAALVEHIMSLAHLLASIVLLERKREAA